MKPTLNATTLGIRMCSTELLFLKNLRGSTRYPMNLYKQDSIADISCNMQFFFGQAISQNNSKTMIVKDFSSLKISNNYCFRKAAQGQLSQCNKRNTVLRGVLKSHKNLNRTKVFAFWCCVRNIKNF